MSIDATNDDDGGKDEGGGGEQMAEQFVAIYTTMLWDCNKEPHYAPELVQI